MVLKNTYMDDVIFSTATNDEAAIITKDVEKLLKTGGFNMKRWMITGLETDGEHKSTDKVL